MKVLFGIDSMFQLMVAINLRMTVFREDDADVILYNSTPSAEGVYEKLRGMEVFDEVFFAKTSLTYCGNHYSQMQKLPKYFIYLESLIRPRHVLKNILRKSLSKPYDVFLFNGYGVLPECIFNACYKINPKIRCRRFEDGYVSYFKEFGKEKGRIRIEAEKIFHFLFRGVNIENYIDGYYFSAPELVMADMPYEILPVPKMNRENVELIETLNEVFDYRLGDEMEYKDKMIFFEDGALFFDNNDEEVEIAKRMARIVTKEKIIVKRHPRRTEDRFRIYGIRSSEKSHVPWEVIQLNCDFSGQPFISVASSVVFSSDIYFGDNCYKILLYDCLKHPSSEANEQFRKFVEKYKKRFGSEFIKEPKSYEELEKVLAGLCR